MVFPGPSSSLEEEEPAARGVMPSDWTPVSGANVPVAEAGSEVRGAHRRARGGIQLLCVMRAWRCMILGLQAAPDPVCVAYLVFFKSLGSVENTQTLGYFT